MIKDLVLVFSGAAIGYGCRAYIAHLDGLLHGKWSEVRDEAKALVARAQEEAEKVVGGLKG